MMSKVETKTERKPETKVEKKPETKEGETQRREVVEWDNPVANGLFIALGLILVLALGYYKFHLLI